MSDLEVLVSGIDYKVRKLTGMMERLEAEKGQLLKEQASLQEVIRQQRLAIEELEEKMLKMSMARSLTSRTEAGEVKQKINQMVREIDRCLALLNK